MADTYTIVSQVPRVRSAPGGQFTRVIEVTFTTKPSGQTGMVDIPADGYGPDTVADIVAAQAAAIERVQHL